MWFDKVDLNIKNCMSVELIFCISKRFGYSLLFIKIEPSRGKTNNVVSEHVSHKPACTVTEAG